MRGLENLNKRLKFSGGNQEKRMINDKLKSLKKALLYSYQAETAILKDDREFRCLINPDKLKPEYDNKIISIPYKDISLNGNGQEEEVNLKPGDVFYWKETNTYWLVYLENIEENAYFRAEIRRCKYEIKVNDNSYRVYIRGPVETDIPWSQKNGMSWNLQNYSLIMYITKNEETLEFFRRFKRVKFDGKSWEVQAVNRYDADGILKIMLNETYNNTIEEEMQEKLPEVIIPDKDTPHIEGKHFVKPYDIEEYKIIRAEKGKWRISNNKAKIISQDGLVAVVEITTGKSGKFDIIYERENEDDIVFPIVIESL